MTDESATAWLVRTGEGGYALTDCVIASVAALRYEAVPDARDLSVAEIVDALKEGGAKSSSETVATMLHRFVHEVRDGDLVVTPHAGSRIVYFGTIAGPYDFVDPSPVKDFRHHREVSWFGQLDRDELPEERLVDIDRQPTLYELPEQSYWWEVSEEADVAPSELRPPPRSQPKTAGKASSARGVDVKHALCEVCGIEKPAQIVEGGVCADCR
ncbi:MAG TPA: hypothetical protein VMW08_18965 [Acidimicrobiales bacterium]|nr:hypothetical protein [Acidimicrobiales bacterium]